MKAGPLRIHECNSGRDWRHAPAPAILEHHQRQESRDGRQRHRPGRLRRRAIWSAICKSSWAPINSTATPVLCAICRNLSGPPASILLIMVMLHIWSSLQLAVVQERGPAASATSSAPVRRIHLRLPHHVLERTHRRRLRRLSPDAVHVRRRRHVRITNSTPTATSSAVSAFPPSRCFYIVAMALLCLHLRHGLWSLFQTLGFYHPRHTPRIKRLASLLVALRLLRIHFHPHRRDAPRDSGQSL